MVPLVAMPLVWGHRMATAKRARPRSETSEKSAAPPQQLSPEGQASLRVILQAGNLPDLRWHDFSDYGKHLQKFYDSYDYFLPGVREMEPTSHAQQVIALLLQA